MPTNHLLIKGKVQGVFYRATAKKLADKLNITGWIKNTADNDVEAMATGNAADINEFTEWCKQGPSRAVVSEVIITHQPEKYFDDFRIMRG